MNGLFSLFSLFYQAGCQLKNILYKIRLFKPKKAPLPVISIGNIAFGGSEKTPLAMAVIAILLNHGHKPALITRGYKGKWEKRGGVLSDGKEILGQWTDSGDEAYMVASNFPQAGIFVGRNKLISCQKAAQLGFEAAILDDGFQHRKLFRDLDIVLHSPGKHRPLREPVSSLKRAHVLLLKKNALNRVSTQSIANTPGTETYIYSVENQGFFSLDGQAQADAEELKTRRALAFCGIARPGRFLSLLAKIGIKPCSFLEFADHHAYPRSSQEKLLNAFQVHQAEVFVTTEKDAVKIKNLEMFQEWPSYYLKIGLQIEEAFEDRVLSNFKNATSNSKKERRDSR